MFKGVDLSQIDIGNSIYKFDKEDQLLYSKDKEGKETWYEYDDGGNITKISSSDGRTELREYFDNGSRKVIVREANGEEYVKVIDHYGRVK